MITVAIPEPIPSLNKGEAAILEGIYAGLSAFEEIRLSVYAPSSWINDDRRNYTRFEVVDGVDLFCGDHFYGDNRKPLGRTYFLKTRGKLLSYAVLSRVSRKAADLLFRDNLLKKMAQADIILAGHDGFLSYDHFWIVLAARLMGKPIALFGGGNDGRGRSPLRIRKKFQFAVNNTILSTVRDAGTEEYLLANGISHDRFHLFPDPAVLLPPCSRERAQEIMKKERIPFQNGRPVFGLIPVRGGIVFDKSFSFEKDRASRYGTRLRFWADILAHLLSTTDAHFVFLPHCIGPSPRNDDRVVSREIFELLPHGKERCTLVENEYSAGEMKGLMRECSFVLGERTHGLIGSFSVGTPCLALTVKEDLRMHNIISRMFHLPTFNLNDPDIGQLKALLSDAWNTRDRTSKAMREHGEVIHTEAWKAARLLRDRINGALQRSI